MDILPYAVTVVSMHKSEKNYKESINHMGRIPMARMQRNFGPSAAYKPRLDTVSLLAGTDLMAGEIGKDKKIKIELH